MIELDTNSEYYLLEFVRYKNSPTHAKIVMMRWALPENAFVAHDPGFAVMLRKHVEAVYIYGRTDEKGMFTQTQEDSRLLPSHAGVDMTEYDTSPDIGNTGALLDPPEIVEYKKSRERINEVRRVLLAEKEGPHVDDPTVRVPSPCPKNRFSEFDLDIVFSHTDYRLRGRAVEE